MAKMEDVENGVREVRKSLIKQELSCCKETSTNESESICMVLLCTAVAVCGSFEFGTCVGYSAPTQSEIMKDIGLSISEYSVFGSILTIGAMIGAVTSGYIADFLGRKGAMRISAIICSIGWLSIYFAKGPYFLYFGRLSSGYGIGVLSYVSINHYHLSARLRYDDELPMTGFLPCLLLLLGLVFIPESPRWLAKMGNQKEFTVALQKLHGKNADITREASEIQECIEIQESLPKAGIKDLFQRRYIRSVIVGVGLMVFQQIGGINGIGFYASEIFVSAGFSSGKLGTILMGTIQVPITMVGAILMDRSGRIPLLMVSASGTLIGTFITGVSFFLKEQGMYTEWVPMLVLCGILVYLGAFSIGMGAVPWVIMSEIFPLNMKGIGGSLVTLVNWFGSWAVSYAFNFLMNWSAPGTFFLFSAACATTILFVAKMVPETKGRSLEEIQESLSNSQVT
ncbi:hypothetical protein ZIOFF_021503 [Zingiber officinale]|uniref:Major facilitator superfamily (MFS) profile domain-containing protein n=1 Tax=Zingiber officinale TaxID=94328 RepID=A0A8J5L8N0_ZINOF|nr:hypothetical protein ZIOFF_021503 [Zingiber officinale]